MACPYRCVGEKGECRQWRAGVKEDDIFSSAIVPSRCAVKVWGRIGIDPIKGNRID